MSEQEKRLDGPDFAQGVALADIAEDGMILGHVAGDSVLLARRGHELFAIGAECAHYHGPLAEGILVEDTVRCPWHHACFSLRTGEALRAPALNPVPCWRVEQRNGTVYVREKIEPTGRARTISQPAPEAIVALRPAQSVEGLSRRQRARGMDTAAPARVLSRAGDRAAARYSRGCDPCQCPGGRACRW